MLRQISILFQNGYQTECRGDARPLGTLRLPGGLPVGGRSKNFLPPSTVQFFDASWTGFGTKHSLLPEISKVTSIHIQYLVHPNTIHLANIAKKMSWLATRSTTREEDMAYFVLGIFEINMPLLYGEGGKVLIRLQEEIIRNSTDHTIFCWSWALSLEPEDSPDWHGCLTPRPITFRDSGNFVPTERARSDLPLDFQLTNNGRRISLPLLDCLSPFKDFKLAVLNVRNLSHDGLQLSQICLCLQSVRGEGFARSRFPNQLFSIPRSWAPGGVNVSLAHE